MVLPFGEINNLNNFEEKGKFLSKLSSQLTISIDLIILLDKIKLNNHKQFFNKQLKFLDNVNTMFLNLCFNSS